MSGQELSGLRKWIQAADLKGRHLEVGTAAGGTLCFMMKCFTEESRPQFTVVDTMSYFDDQMNIVKKNLAQNGLDSQLIDFRVMPSVTAFTHAEAAREQFDFILVDASHKIRHVMEDLRWLRLLNTGGIACFHDYAIRFKGVCWPIDRFLRRNPHFSRVGLEDSLLCIRKNAEASQTEVTAFDRVWALLWSPILQLDLSLQKRLKPKQASTTN
ncbi:MAG: hypothetical protein CMJ68_13180 [Planctomycetaceae bacterium]|nr:hypothetical protein [Planctomycetaceae bacterium]|tara:strand:- start:3711 stop:4349 length:639 start_codon:yes stop_codon:yes gene_type:complete